MSIKSANVIWSGSGKTGRGEISTETPALKSQPYGFGSRFGDPPQPGTNPEELVAAAHAACFTMAFSFACDKAGFPTTRLETSAKVRLMAQGDGFLIDQIALSLRAEVPGLEEQRFQQLAKAAKEGCPLSKALASVPEISLQAVLVKTAS